MLTTIFPAWKIQDCAGRRRNFAGTKIPMKELKSKLKSKFSLQAWAQEFRGYCSETTLHGFRYLSDKKMSVTEKILWFTICALSSGLSVYLMLIVWNKYSCAPMNCSIVSTIYPIWEIPFPAVTVCNFNKIYEPNARRFADHMRKRGYNETQIEYTFIVLKKLIHEDHDYLQQAAKIANFPDITNNPEKLMYELMQPCEKLVVACKWLGVSYNCSNIIKTVKTPNGFCCSFNHHVLNGEYPPVSEVEASQRNLSWEPGVKGGLSVAGSGPEFSLSLLINVESENYQASLRPYFGAMVYIHDPLVYPEVDVEKAIVQPGQELAMLLTGNIVESEEFVRALHLDQRKCWFHDEVKLNTSKEYNYQSCVTECRMHHLAVHCQCIPYWYPTSPISIRKCSVPDVECLKMHMDGLGHLQSPYIDEKFGNTVTKVSKLECHHECLPRCSRMHSTARSEKAHFTSNDIVVDEMSAIKMTNHSMVTVYFPEITCTKWHRATLMTWCNLLAAFGGVFGLCIGGSVVSIIEIVYYVLVTILGIRKSEAARDLKISSEFLRNSNELRLLAKNQSTIWKIDVMDLDKYKKGTSQNTLTFSQRELTPKAT